MLSSDPLSPELAYLSNVEACSDYGAELAKIVELAIPRIPVIESATGLDDEASNAGACSDNQSYVNFYSLYSLVYSCWIFRVLGGTSDDPDGVMLPSCQDLFLVLTYINLPKIL